MKLWRPFKEWPALIKATILMIPASLTIFLNQSIDPMAADTKEVITYYYQKELRSFGNAFNFTYLIPLKEEAMYRWPALGLLVSLLWMLKRLKKDCKSLRITIHTVSWMLLVGLTYYWAGFHDYPIPVFCYGLVWGWLIMYTRQPLYSWLFHSLSNTFCILMIVTGYHYFY